MKDQKEVKVTKMVIQLTDEQISLSLADAKKLHEALAELFGKKTVEHIYHNDYWYYRPYRWYGETYLSAKSSLSEMSAKSSAMQSLGMNDNLAKYATASGVSFEAKGSTLMCDLSKPK